MNERAQVEIGQLRASVCSSCQDDFGLRNQLSSLCESADLRLPGFSPASILIVQRLRDPLPRRFRDATSPALVSESWEIAARDRLDEARRRASRPEFGRIPATASAALFEDETELLACLALDILAGTVGSRWWWRYTAQRWLGSQVEDIYDFLCESPERLPGVFVALDEWRLLPQVVAKLSGRQSRDLLRRLVVHYNLPFIGNLLETWGDSNVSQASGLELAMDEESTETARLSIADFFSEDRLAANDEEVDREILQGLALALSRRPAMARAARFAVELNAWRMRRAFLGRRREARVLESRVGVDTVNEKPTEDTDSLRRGGAGQPAMRRASEPELEGSASDESSRQVPGAPLGRLSHTTSDFRDTASDSDQVSNRDVSLDARRVSPDKRREGGGDEHFTPPTTERDRARVSPLDSGSPPIKNRSDSSKRVDNRGSERGAQTDSEMNPRFEARASREGLHTQLAGVFYLINVVETLAAPAEFSRWALVETFARTLMRDAPLRYYEDPIWTTLFELDGRENAVVAADIEAWLERRLDELIVPLRELLGNVSQREFEFAPILLHSGTIIVTRSQIDVIMGMEQISLAVRRAGLDRDPGWLPDFGYIVRFHFVDATR